MPTMLVRAAPRRLTARVEIDDAYLGGERVGEKPGRGSPNKVRFVAAVQTELVGKPHLMRLTAVAGFTKTALADWARHALAPGAHVASDGLWCFEAVTKVANTTHERHVVGRGAQAVKRPEFRWVNTMLGNLKTALAGTYQWFDYAILAVHCQRPPHHWADYIKHHFWVGACGNWRSCKPVQTNVNRCGEKKS